MVLYPGYTTIGQTFSRIDLHSHVILKKISRKWTTQTQNISHHQSPAQLFPLNKDQGKKKKKKKMHIHLGHLPDLTNARYVVHLSDGKRLVLFRLPTIEPPTFRDRAAAATEAAAAANETANGWAFYAMEAECPHAGGPMEDSAVDIEDSAYVASCPWHAYDFNVETGESSVGIKACTYPVVVAGERVGLSYPVDEGVGLVRMEPVTEKVKLKKSQSQQQQQNGEKMSPQSLDVPPGPQYLDDNATFCDWAVHILNTWYWEHKIELTVHLFSIFSKREGTSSPMEIGRGTVTPPANPPREGLNTVKPTEMPRSRGGGSLKSRITMLHALANIELWAIDLAVDICVRFSTFHAERNARELPRAFFHDWLKVANDEAKHFSFLRSRLEEMGTYFGALPVHHGLWDSATATSHDLRARICIIALVHEARGLDVNPMTIDKFRKAGDTDSVGALEVIHNDEITHVTTGHRWLTWICGQEDTDPVHVFRSNVQMHFRSSLKGPFNTEARLQAGMDQRYYENLEKAADVGVAF